MDQTRTLTSVEPRCAAGNVATQCCVGDPQALLTDDDTTAPGQPLPAAVIAVAAKRGVGPHALAFHVMTVHEWQPHQPGFAGAVAEAAACIQMGGCEM